MREAGGKLRSKRGKAEGARAAGRARGAVTPQQPLEMGVGQGASAAPTLTEPISIPSATVTLVTHVAETCK